tara:strand:- start:246 stop:989 length:744 start_codon:yes stop_codon:yes gene_type:complete
MAYYTGTDVKIWIALEHDTKGIMVKNNAETAEDVIQLTNSSDVTAAESGVDSIGAMQDCLGESGYNIPDVVGIDLAIGAQDEDISYFGSKTMGKIKVKSDIQVTMTIKQKHRLFSMLSQGSVFSSDSVSDGAHSARYGLITNTAGTDDVIADGTTDPKGTLDTDGNQCFGYRVAVMLKAPSTSPGDDGTVLIIRNASIGEYTVTTSNDAVNEESIQFVSMVDPLVVSGKVTGTKFDGATTFTTAAEM